MKGILCLLIMVLGGGDPGGPRPDPFAMVARKPEVFQPLPLGAVKPDGWLKQQIQSNLRGYTGHLDSLAPDLLIRDDIYGRDRLTKDVKRKDVGALAGGGEAAEVQYLWWNSETQGNWRDGFIRSAVLTGDKEALDRARAYVRRILATQDADGYLGIYDRDLRYRFDGENGELWSKTTLLRGLLAWYEYSDDPAVLTAIERAVEDVMRHYPPGASHPFYSIKPDVGGLSHGLLFTDVLEELYRLTGRPAYLDYTIFLYKDFSAADLHEDAQYAKLTDTGYRLKGHGVHTYEHVRSVAAAAYASGNPALQKALNDYLIKVGAELLPSGAPAGDEWIGGRVGDATSTGYEYCSLQELMDSWADLYGKTGTADYGDKVERLFFNAAQGARETGGCGIAYLKTDNSYAMTGGLNGDARDPRQTRYKYSPVHQDVAVCCVPNAGRIAPYDVDRMWMRSGAGLAATLLGPCTVRTSWAGRPLEIEEKTSYPNGFTLDFVVRPERPVEFTLAIRRPVWAGKITLSCPYTEKRGYILIRRIWRPGETVHLRLDPGVGGSAGVAGVSGVAVHRDRHGAVYFSYGPLVLAHPIPSTGTIGRRYPLPGFYDSRYRPDSLRIYDYRGGVVERSGEPFAGFGGVRFRVALYDTVARKEEKVWLEPMGGTILRQVTFGPIK